MDFLEVIGRLKAAAQALDAVGAVFTGVGVRCTNGNSLPPPRSILAMKRCRRSPVSPEPKREEPKPVTGEPPKIWREEQIS
jgi:hypothetical protein